MIHILRALSLALVLLAAPALGQTGGALVDADIATINRDLDSIRATLAEVADTSGGNAARIDNNVARIEALEGGTPEPPSPTPVGLKFAPPQMVNPLIVDVPPTGSTGAKYIFAFPKNRDVILMMPPTPRLEPMWVEGGNIRIIGGVIDLCNWEPDWMSRALLLKPSGHHFVEGTRIKLCGKELDAFVHRAGSRTAIITLQSFYVTGIGGSRGGLHGDLFQTQSEGGGVLGELRIERGVSWTEYNHIVGTEILNMHVIDVELHKTRATQNVSVAVSTRLNLTAENAWIDAAMWRPDRTLVLSRDLTESEIAKHKATRATVIPRFDQGSVQEGATIRMPTLRSMSGVWNIGVPEGGSRSPGAPGLVDPADIGLNYVSPWPID